MGFPYKGKTLYDGLGAMSPNLAKGI
jgi:hypothetical protein